MAKARPSPAVGPARVERLGHDGDGSAAVDGGTVFVRGALPGERVRLGPAWKDGSIRRALLEAIEEPSPDRVEPACPITATCGGCPLMIASESLELREKKALVERAFSNAGLEVAVEIVGPAPMLAYRTRARLAFRGKRLLGYRAFGTRELVDVDHCAVLAPALDAALVALRATLAPTLVDEGEIHLGLGAHGAVVSVRSDGPQGAATFTALAGLVERGALGGAAIVAGGATAVTTYGDALEQAHDVDGRALTVPLGGFRQAHEGASAELARTVLAWSGLDEPHPGEASPRRVLELYAGHGNFTLPLAARAASVVAVESAATSTAALAKNLATHGLRAKVVTADAADATAKEKRSSADVVVLDPPRAGARECIDALVLLRPPVLVYVSCDPRTLARDCAALVQRGYVLERVKAVNCFPRTASIEAVAKLVRTPSAR